MRFVDEASLHIKAGDGGRGCVSFRREAHVPKGGPNGGDGGKGGDVIIMGQKNLLSLLDFKYKRNYKAGNGKPGGTSNRTGRNGEDVYIAVPVGTEIRDREYGSLLADIVENGQTYIAAKGGRGGRGNTRFVSPVHRTPTEYDEGQPGEERNLNLELKLLASIGIIGLPNAGKSTMLSRLTAATPEVGDYPFTTLTPSLGVMIEDRGNLVLADIPGIIEGASMGKGLGLTFLRHIERTRFLLWVIDASSPSVTNDYKTLYDELASYNDEIAKRPRILVLNKIDLVPPSALKSKKVTLSRKGDRVILTSAMDGRGIEELKQAILDVQTMEKQ
jgi:GTP-binding protein